MPQAKKPQFCVYQGLQLGSQRPASPSRRKRQGRCIRAYCGVKAPFVGLKDLTCRRGAESTRVDHSRVMAAQQWSVAAALSIPGQKVMNVSQASWSPLGGASGIPCMATTGQTQRQTYWDGTARYGRVERLAALRRAAAEASTMGSVNNA